MVDHIDGNKNKSTELHGVSRMQRWEVVHIDKADFRYENIIGFKTVNLRKTVRNYTWRVYPLSLAVDNLLLYSILYRFAVWYNGHCGSKRTSG